MESCFRQCPKCLNNSARFYVQEEPKSDKPYYLVVFVCQAEGCRHEWTEPIYEERILRKIKSSGYRQGYVDNEVLIRAEEEKKQAKRHEEKKLTEKWKGRGLTEQEIKWKLKLRIKKVGGRL